MQIPSNSTDPFIKSLTEKGEKIRSLFLGQVNSLTKKIQLKVMLGDGTVSDQESFDPVLVRQFYDDILRKLPNWVNQGVSASTDKDLRRSFIKFEVKEGNYLLSAYMSLQYHALLFYKLDHKVIEIQKELTELTDKIKDLQENIKPESDKIIEEKLKQKGYENMDHQKLFEVLFENDEMTKELAESMRSTELKINDLIKRRDSLFQELDNMLIEVYHTSSVMIDEMRMIAAEEGCLCNFNLEYMKNNSNEGNFNPIRIPAKVKEDLLKHMDDLVKVLEF
ncbi:MAG: hypothetical protein ACREA3_01690 [Nitrosotalea sp.]